jgi:hypothetical protein
MRTRVRAQRLELHVITSLLLVVLFCTPTHGQSKNKEVFASVPVTLRPRLVERLKLLIEYQGAQQWGKQYDLLSGLVVQGDTKEEHIKRLEHWYAQGLGDILVDFVPTSVAVHSASADYGEWTLFGCARLREKARIVDLYASVSAYREKGDWYFSPIGVITPIDGKPELCPYRKDEEETETGQQLEHRSPSHLMHFSAQKRSRE